MEPPKRHYTPSPSTTNPSKLPPANKQSGPTKPIEISISPNETAALKYFYGLKEQHQKEDVNQKARDVSHACSGISKILNQSSLVEFNRDEKESLQYVTNQMNYWIEHFLNGGILSVAVLNELSNQTHPNLFYIPVILQGQFVILKIKKTDSRFDLYFIENSNIGHSHQPLQKRDYRILYDFRSPVYSVKADCLNGLLSHIYTKEASFNNHWICDSSEELKSILDLYHGTPKNHDQTDDYYARTVDRNENDFQAVLKSAFADALREVKPTARREEQKILKLKISSSMVAALHSSYNRWSDQPSLQKYLNVLRGEARRVNKMRRYLQEHDPSLLKQLNTQFIQMSTDIQRLIKNTVSATPLQNNTISIPNHPRLNVTKTDLHFIVDLPLESALLRYLAGDSSIEINRYLSGFSRSGQIGGQLVSPENIARFFHYANLFSSGELKLLPDDTLLRSREEFNSLFIEIQKKLAAFDRADRDLTDKINRTNFDENKLEEVQKLREAFNFNKTQFNFILIQFRSVYLKTGLILFEESKRRLKDQLNHNDFNADAYEFTPTYPMAHKLVGCRSSIDFLHDMEVFEQIHRFKENSDPKQFHVSEIQLYGCYSPIFNLKNEVQKFQKNDRSLNHFIRGVISLMPKNEQKELKSNKSLEDSSELLKKFISSNPLLLNYFSSLMIVEMNGIYRPYQQQPDINTGFNFLNDYDFMGYLNSTDENKTDFNENDDYCLERLYSGYHEDVLHDPIYMMELGLIRISELGENGELRDKIKRSILTPPHLYRKIYENPAETISHITNFINQCEKLANSGFKYTHLALWTIELKSHLLKMIDYAKLHNRFDLSANDAAFWGGDHSIVARSQNFRSLFSRPGQDVAISAAIAKSWITDFINHPSIENSSGEELPYIYEALFHFIDLRSLYPEEVYVWMISQFISVYGNKIQSLFENLAQSSQSELVTVTKRIAAFRGEDWPARVPDDLVFNKKTLRLTSTSSDFVFDLAGFFVLGKVQSVNFSEVLLSRRDEFASFHLEESDFNVVAHTDGYFYNSSNSVRFRRVGIQIFVEKKFSDQWYVCRSPILRFEKNRSGEFFPSSQEQNPNASQDRQNTFPFDPADPNGFCLINNKAELSIVWGDHEGKLLWGYNRIDGKIYHLDSPSQEPLCYFNESMFGYTQPELVRKLGEIDGNISFLAKPGNRPSLDGFILNDWGLKFFWEAEKKIFICFSPPYQGYEFDKTQDLFFNPKGVLVLRKGADLKFVVGANSLESGIVSLDSIYKKKEIVDLSENRTPRYFVYSCKVDERTKTDHLCIDPFQLQCESKSAALYLACRFYLDEKYFIALKFLKMSFRSDESYSIDSVLQSELASAKRASPDAMLFMYHFSKRNRHHSTMLTVPSGETPIPVGDVADNKIHLYISREEGETEKFDERLRYELLNPNQLFSIPEIPLTLDQSFFSERSLYRARFDTTVIISNAKKHPIRIDFKFPDSFKRHIPDLFSPDIVKKNTAIKEILYRIYASKLNGSDRNNLSEETPSLGVILLLSYQKEYQYSTIENLKSFLERELFGEFDKRKNWRDLLVRDFSFINSGERVFLGSNEPLTPNFIDEPVEGLDKKKPIQELNLPKRARHAEVKPSEEIHFQFNSEPIENLSPLFSEITDKSFQVTPSTSPSLDEANTLSDSIAVEMNRLRAEDSSKKSKDHLHIELGPEADLSLMATNLINEKTRLIELRDQIKEKILKRCNLRERDPAHLMDEVAHSIEKEISWDELLQCYLTGNLVGLQKKFPGLKEDLATEIFSDIHKHLQYSSLADQADEAIGEIQKAIGLMNSIQSGEAGAEDSLKIDLEVQINRIYQIVSHRRVNYLHDERYLLYFEVMSGLRLRDDQYNKIIWAVNLASKGDATGMARILQAYAGFGKTKVFSTILSFMILQHGKIPAVFQIPQLFDLGKNDLESALEESFQKKLESVDLPIDFQIADKDLLSRYLDHLHQVKANGQILVVKPITWHKINTERKITYCKLKRLEKELSNQKQIESEQNTIEALEEELSCVAESYRLLEGILSFWKQNVFALYDEGHIIFSPLQDVNIATGHENSLPVDQIDLLLWNYDHVLRWDNDTRKLNILKNKQFYASSSSIDALKKELVEQAIDRFDGISEKKLRKFLSSNRNQPLPNWVKEMLNGNEHDKKLGELIVLQYGIISSLVESCLSRQGSVDYGDSIHPDDPTAAPRENKRISGAQFEEKFVTAIFTIQHIYQKTYSDGLDEENFWKLIGFLQEVTKKTGDLEFERIIQRSLDRVSPELAKQFSFADFPSINTIYNNQVYEALKRDKEIADLFLRHIALPSIKTASRNVTSTPSEMMFETNGILLTATPKLLETLPFPVASEANRDHHNLDRASEFDTRQAMVSQRNQSVRVLPEESDRSEEFSIDSYFDQFSNEEILSLGHIVDGGKMFDRFSEEEVARGLLKRVQSIDSNAIRYIVFTKTIDGRRCDFILKPDGVAVMLESSDIPSELDRLGIKDGANNLVYYYSIQETTGKDWKLRPNSRGMFTVGPNHGFTEAIQNFKRDRRALERDKSIIYFMHSSVKDKILKHLKRDPNSEVSNRDIVSWMEENDAKEWRALIQSRFKQGVDAILSSVAFEFASINGVDVTPFIMKESDLPPSKKFCFENLDSLTYRQYAIDQYHLLLQGTTFRKDNEFNQLNEDSKRQIDQLIQKTIELLGESIEPKQGLHGQQFKNKVQEKQQVEQRVKNEVNQKKWRKQEELDLSKPIHKFESPIVTNRNVRPDELLVNDLPPLIQSLFQNKNCLFSRNFFHRADSPAGPIFQFKPCLFVLCQVINGQFYLAPLTAKEKTSIERGSRNQEEMKKLKLQNNTFYVISNSIPIYVDSILGERRKLNVEELKNNKSVKQSMALIHFLCNGSIQDEKSFKELFFDSNRDQIERFFEFAQKYHQGSLNVHYAKKLALIGSGDLITSTIRSEEKKRISESVLVNPLNRQLMNEEKDSQNTGPTDSVEDTLEAEPVEEPPVDERPVAQPAAQRSKLLSKSTTVVQVALVVVSVIGIIGTIFLALELAELDMNGINFDWQSFKEIINIEKWQGLLVTIPLFLFSGVAFITITVKKHKKLNIR